MQNEKKERETRGGIDYSSLVKYLLGMLTTTTTIKPNQTKQKNPGLDLQQLKIKNHLIGQLLPNEGI